MLTVKASKWLAEMRNHKEGNDRSSTRIWSEIYVVIISVVGYRSLEGRGGWIKNWQINLTQRHLILSIKLGGQMGQWGYNHNGRSISTTIDTTSHVISKHVLGRFSHSKTCCKEHATVQSSSCFLFNQFTLQYLASLKWDHLFNEKTRSHIQTTSNVCNKSLREEC